MEASPPGVTIACSYPPQSGTCATTQPFGTSITLTATPGSTSLHSSWGGDCQGTGPCNVTLNSTKNVTATFITMPPVRNVGPPPVYDSSLQVAYDKVIVSATIEAQSTLPPENFILHNPVALVLKGGFDAGFLTRTGYTTLQGNVTISKGSLVADRLAIRSPSETVS